MKAMKTQIFLISLLAVINLTSILQAQTNLPSSSENQIIQLSELLTSGFQAQQTDAKDMLVTEDQLGVNGSFSLVYAKAIQSSFEPKLSMPVGRDAIVAVISSSNPELKAILKKGINTNKMKEMLIGNQQQILFSNNFVWEQMSSFSQTTISEPKTYNEKQAFISGITSNTIGFCLLSEIMDGSQKYISGIQLIPVDRNNNGEIDTNEDFYSNPQTFARALWLGKYPKALSQNILIVSQNDNLNETETAFINWIFTQGQQVMADNGFIALNNHEQLAALKAFNSPIDNPVNASTESTSNAWIMIMLIALGGVVIFGLFITWIFTDRTSPDESVVITTPGSFNLNSIQSPKGIMYDTTHTWAFMENDGMVKVGVDDFLHHIFGKIDQVKIHSTGKAFKKGESLTTFIHKGKQISIQSPVSGKIIAVNEAFSTKNPDVTSNWLYKIEPTNWKRESSFLLMVDSYTEWMKSEFNRFREFLNTTMHQHSPQHAYIALQDGGELQEGLMTGLEPAVWEDFQQQFLKASR